jgi:hypothetical protein
MAMKKLRSQSGKTQVLMETQKIFVSEQEHMSVAPNFVNDD